MVDDALLCDYKVVMDAEMSSWVGRGGACHVEWPTVDMNSTCNHDCTAGRGRRASASPYGCAYTWHVCMPAVSLLQSFVIVTSSSSPLLSHCRSHGRDNVGTIHLMFGLLWSGHRRVVG